MIREISYQVSSSGITPHTVQYAGVQGEQNVTRLSFSLDSNLLSKLTEAAKGATLYYRFDIYDSLGCSNSTEPIALEESQQVYYDIGLQLSAVGGNAKVYLVITAINEDKTEAELISVPALINFTKKAGAEYDQLQKESLSALYAGAVKNAQEAKASEEISTENAEAVETARQQVEKNTQMVMRVIGEFPEIDEKLDNAQELLTQCEGATEELKSIKEELAEGGYITGIKESNHGVTFKVWAGTQEKYDSLEEKPANTLMIIEDDDTLEKLSVDYIVETGVNDDGWLYEIWKSGKCKLYGDVQCAYLDQHTLSGDKILPFEFSKIYFCNSAIHYVPTENTAWSYSWNTKTKFSTTGITAVIHCTDNFSTDNQIGVTVEVVGKLKQEG